MELQKVYDAIDGMEVTVGDVAFSDLTGSDINFSYNVNIEDPKAVIEALSQNDSHLLQDLTSMDQITYSPDEAVMVRVADAIDSWDVSERLQGLSRAHEIMY